jgi:hypothetical protein
LCQVRVRDERVMMRFIVGCFTDLLCSKAEPYDPARLAESIVTKGERRTKRA